MTEITFQTEVAFLHDDLTINEDIEPIQGLGKLIVTCHQATLKCDPNVYIMYPQATHSNYMLRVTLDDNYLYENMLESIEFYVYGNDESYTTFLLLLRYFSLVLSLIALLSYWRFYKSIPVALRTFEHKAVMWLSAGLIAFNDPLYGITVLKANCFMAVLSTLFVTGFISALLFFWIVMVRRIHVEKSQSQTQQMNPLTIGIAIVAFELLSASGIVASIFSRWNPSEHFYLQ